MSSVLHYKRNGSVHLSRTVESMIEFLNCADAPFDAYCALYPYLSERKGQFTYCENDGFRDPLPMGYTIVREPGSFLKRDCQHNALWNHVLKAAKDRASSEPQSEPQNVPTPDPTPEPEPLYVCADFACMNPVVREGRLCGECNSREPEPTPDPVESDFWAYYAELERLRIFAESRDLPTLDSMRLAIDGFKLINAGLPVKGLLANVVNQWGADTMLQAGIRPFDWAAWGAENGTVGDFDHAATPAIIAAIAANIPVWIWGGAGIGKSVGAKKAADMLGIPYYECNLSGQMASAVTGRDRLNEFVVSTFEKAYRDGGVWNGEEIDNADPRVLTAINNAVAGKEFWNPVTGECVKRHADFRIVVTANTNGTGAGAGFIRNKIDKASTDRFNVGMFLLKLDKRLEKNILKGMIAEFRKDS